ncbi:MAG: DUF1002 domain-containing protein [Methanobrevibacter thaueri]|nr:DUF1002 domain-containing protein [Methanobrevibacter thaueri]
MSRIHVLCMFLIIVCLVLPVGFGNDSDSVVITYGETTQSNLEYKGIVNDYFVNHAHVDVGSTNNKIMTSKDINDLYGSVFNESFSRDQIFTTVLADLNDTNDLDVVVDSSKITLVDSDMLESALRSAGITYGRVFITSPVEDNGVMALGEILNSYESVTNMEIPGDVKKAVICEISVEASILENSNVSKKDLINLVEDVKKESVKDNISTYDDMVKLINKSVVKDNLSLCEEDVDSLSSMILFVNMQRDDARDYMLRISDFSGGSCTDEYSLYNIIK